MSFTLTGQTIAAFFLGAVTVGAPWPLLLLWKLCVRDVVELLIFPTIATIVALVVWASLFSAAFS